MSAILADIDATCAALGYNDGEKYFAEPDAIQGLKHLIWILRRDLDNHEYRRHLGRAKVLQTDLVPMLINYIDNNEYSDVLIRLLIILTNPILLLYRDGIPKDGNGRKIYLELIDILQNYKTSFSSETFWSVLTLRLHKVLEVDWALRSEEQNLLIERILVLARNVLQVPSNPDIECRADNDASLHDQIIWALHKSGMLDLILYVLSSTNENQYHLHALEIVCLLYREQTAESLADASLQRSVAEKYRDEQELVAVRKREKQKNISKIPQGRHSRFGGTYVLRNVKSVSEKDIICHQSLERAVSIDFDREKSKQKRSHRFVSEENVTERRSAFSVRLCLREYCIEVLRSGYNTLVRQVRRVLEHSTGSSSHDDSYLLWAIRFFMEFNRLSGLQLDLVSESLSVQCFHWVLMRIDHHMDMMRNDKKEARLWSKRLHIAIQTFRELLLSLIALQKLKDEKALALFDMLQNNVCYVLEYREMILHLLMNYNETHSTKAYLRDVVETANIFIKIMEKFCKDPVLVQDRKRQRKKNKNGKKSSSTKAKKSQQNMNTNENENLEDKWAGLASEIASTLTQNIQLPEESQPIPFDAASDKSIDDQKDDCMLRIYKFLREENFEKAIVLIRSAREVWPENDCFGAISSSPEDELMLLREIYLSDLGPVEKPAKNDDDNDDDDEQNNEEDYYNNDEENEEEENIIVEKDFRFEDFAKRLVNPKVVRACTLVLTDWEKISTKSLKSAVTILHRIAFGCKCSAMLYQATLFRIFQQVFHAPKDDHNEELRRLGIYIIRNFTETAPNNPKIYAELLFYKTLKEANDIETGYTDDYNTNYKGSWSEEQENELRILFEENQKNPETDKDVIDWILDNLIDKTRTRRAVMKKLREMGLIFKAPTKKTNAAAAKKILWKYEEDEQLRNLYDEFRLQPDCLNKILEVLRDKHSKNTIIKRMISLGLIADKSEILPNKKISKKRKTQNIRSHNEGNSDNDDDDNDGYPIQQQNTFMNIRKNNKKGQKNNNRKSKNKRTNIKTPLHVGSIQNLLDQIDEQFKEAINWLKDCLNDAAEDLKDDELPDDEDDGVPLVPLLDIQREALNNEQFKKVLITLGIQPPITEMENYWRIPIYLNAADLNMRVQILNGTYTGSAEGEDDNDGGNIEKGNDDCSDNDDDDGSDDDDNGEDGDEDENGTDDNISSSSDEEIDLHENIMNKRREQFDNLVFNRSDDEDEYREPLKTRENSQSNMKTKKQDKITNINQSKNEKILNKENSNSKKKHGKFNIDNMIKTTQDIDDDENFSSQNLRLRLAELTGDTDESDAEDQNAIEKFEPSSSSSSSSKTRATATKVNSFIHSRIRRNVIDSDSSDEDKGINDDDDDDKNDSIATKNLNDKKISMTETNNLLQYPVINTGIEIMQSNDENELNDNVSQVKKNKIYQIDSDSKSKVSNKRNRSEDGEQEISDDDDDNEEVVIIKKKKITNVNDTIRQRKRIAVIDDDDDDELDKDDNGSVAGTATSGGAGDDDDDNENGRKNIDKMILMEDDE